MRVAIAWVLFLPAIAFAQQKDAPPVDEATRCFKTGLTFRYQMSKARSRAQATALLEKAVEQFSEAAHLQPERCDAQVMWADCLWQLVKIHASQKQPLEQPVQAARERFAIAARCKDAKISLFVEWAELLTFQADQVAAAGEPHRAVLRELQSVYEQALPLAHYSHERAPLERELAKCFVVQARSTDDLAERRELFTRAVARFESALNAHSETHNASIFAGLGLALLDLAKLKDNDAALLRQSIERLNEAVKLNPRDAIVYYNLACDYALLKQTTPAIEQVRLCLDHDARQTMREAFKSDPDFEALRNERAFQELISEKPQIAEAHKLFVSGVEQFSLAEKAETDADAVAHYRQAVDLFAKAIVLKPDHYGAQTMAARALGALADRTPEPQSHVALIKSALEHLAAASKCKEADSTLYGAWGDILLAEHGTLAATDGERIALLKEARQRYGAALELARFSSDRAAIQRGLALSLAYLADIVKDFSQRRPLCEEAIVQFEGTDRLRSLKSDPTALSMWGVAFLHLGRLGNDRALLRKAAEKFLVAVELEPDNTQTQYNLACTYALLMEREAALRHLRLCLDNDPDRGFSAAAARDSDFKSLRNLRDYQSLVAVRTPVPGTVTPPISNR